MPGARCSYEHELLAGKLLAILQHLCFKKAEKFGNEVWDVCRAAVRETYILRYTACSAPVYPRESTCSVELFISIDGDW